MKYSDLRIVVKSHFGRECKWKVLKDSKFICFFEYFGEGDIFWELYKIDGCDEVRRDEFWNDLEGFTFENQDCPLVLNSDRVIVRYAEDTDLVHVRGLYALLNSFTIYEQLSIKLISYLER